jgi:hypothetical protein
VGTLGDGRINDESRPSTMGKRQRGRKHEDGTDARNRLTGVSNHAHAKGTGVQCLARTPKQPFYCGFLLPLRRQNPFGHLQLLPRRQPLFDHLIRTDIARGAQAANLGFACALWIKAFCRIHNRVHHVPLVSQHGKFNYHNSTSLFHHV